MINKSGATPVFCAPEQIQKSEIEWTDVHAFGITILLSFYSVISGLQLLYCAKKDLNKSTFDSFKSCEIIKLVKDMTKYKANQRIKLELVEERLKNLVFFKEWIGKQNSKLQSIITTLGVPLSVRILIQTSLRRYPCGEN